MLLNLQEERGGSSVLREHVLLFLPIRACTPSPQVYTAGVQRQASRHGEQGSKGAVDLAGLVAVAAPGTGVGVHGQQKHQATH